MISKGESQTAFDVLIANMILLTVPMMLVSSAFVQLMMGTLKLFSDIREGFFDMHKK